MTVLRAFRALDMQTIIRNGGELRGGDDEVVLRVGDLRTVFTGPIRERPSGFGGTIREFSQSDDGRLVFEATEVGRSATVALGYVEDRDNERFLNVVLSADDQIFGSRREDYLVGLSGDDTIAGGNGADRLNGNAGLDTLKGGAGNDFLIGGLDADRMVGGKDDDLYLVDSTADEVVEKRGGGVDTILSTLSLTIVSKVERLVLIGEDDTSARGSAGDDRLVGNVAENRLFGDRGEDLLDGGAGRDVLVGGIGKDVLYGRRGADVFLFNRAREAKEDWIGDFGRGDDLIDVSGIDANTNRSGEQSFDFIRDSEFSGRAGELAFRYGALSGDVDGDKEADLLIRVGQDTELRYADLIL